MCSHDQRSGDSCQSTEVKALPRCLRIVREHVCLSYRFTDEGHTKAVGFITQRRYLIGTFDILLSTTASTQPSVRCCGPIRGSAPHVLPFCARTSRHGEVRKASTYFAVGATAIWRQRRGCEKDILGGPLRDAARFGRLRASARSTGVGRAISPGDDPLRMPEVKNFETPAAYATMRSFAAGARSCSGGGSG